jgi:hypothetical protein
VGNLREGDHLEDRGADVMIILKWIFYEWDGRLGLGQSGSGQEHVTGCYERGNEPPGSIKCGEFLE